MEPLETDQLIDLEEAILDRFFEVLTRKNADGSLERLLREMGLQNLLFDVLGISTPLSTLADGNILIVGADERMVKHLSGIAKDLGISVRRLKYVSYNEATNYPFESLAHNHTWSAILVGQNPHSVRGKGDSSSIISEIRRNQEKYPPMFELRTGNELKITKTNFSSTLKGLLESGVVKAG